MPASRLTDPYGAAMENQATSIDTQGVREAGGTSILKLSLLSLASTSIEWYDFFLYGIASALVFPTVFFPETMSHSVAVVASFLTFAAGFIARPIGGLVFGYMGDRVGRKRALATALFLMGGATLLIAFVPSYAAIGAAAPILLVLLRVAQGIAIGGQWGGAVLIILENAPARHRGFYGSFAQAGAPVGILLANLAFLAAGALLTPEEFLAWGWRLPFLGSIVLIGFGLYFKYRMEETPVYRELLEHRPTPALEPTRSAAPIVQLLRHYPRQLALATLSQLAVNLCFYINVTWVISYGTDPGGLNIPYRTMLAGVLYSSCLLPPVILLFGATSDRIGRRGLYMAGALLMMGAAFILFPMIETRSIVWITLGSILASLPLMMMYAPQAALFGELFPTSLRYSGVSFSYQVGAIFGGGFSPVVATTLMSAFHTTAAVSCYMAVACAVAFFAVMSMRETAGLSLNAVGRS